jgi:CrcB protein
VTSGAQRLGGAFIQRVSTFLAIGAGGFLGANCRFLVGLWAESRWGAAFPWGTLLINVAGSFILGLYLTLVSERFMSRPATRLMVTTGFLGTFTTFSTFSYEAVQLFQHGEAGTALAYICASLALGLVAATAGVICAHAV